MALPYVRARAYTLAQDVAWDDVYVTASLADVLRHGEVSAAPLAVSVASAADAREKRASLLAAGTLAWAHMAPPEMEDSFGIERGELAVFVPLAHAWRSIQGAESVAVCAVQPVPLTCVYLTLPHDAYTAYTQHQDSRALLAQLDGHMVRSGGAIHAPGLPCAAHCLHTEPVAQGAVDARTTALYLVDGGATPPGAPHGPHAPAPDASAAPAPDAELVLDETFLERSLARATLDDEAHAVTAHRTVLRVALDADRGVLEDAIAHWHKATGTDTYIDTESVVLVSDAALARLAAFNGDWALAEVPDAARAPRLVRVVSGRTEHAAIPPTLAWNLAGDAALSADALDVALQPLPTHVADEVEVLRDASDVEVRALAGTPAQPPLMPRADTLSVARVASPLSTDRALEAACLDALRAHLEHRPRVLHRGDVFAVPVVAARARFVQRDAEDDAPSDAARDVAHGAQLPSTLAPSYARGAVYFCVTELDAHLADPATVRAQIPASAPALQRWYATLTASGAMDRAGCWVDAEHTRIVQTGVVQRRVADVSAWLGLTNDTPRCPPPDTPLTSDASVYGRFVRLVRAALSPSAQHLGVHLAVLLQGAPGAGKRMVTRWVAQRTGVHLLELDAYELVSDTDARTEGVLRAKFARAASCTPCILLLQHIDVLAKKGQNEAQTAALVKMLQRCMDEQDMRRGAPLFLVGTTDDAEKCPPTLLACFNQTLQLDPPGEPERKQLLDMALARYAVAADVDTKQLAVQTAALLPADLSEVVERARLLSTARLAASLAPSYTTADLAAARPVLVHADLDAALGAVRASYSESIGAPKIPNVTWDDVGGLASVKHEILDTVQLPLEHPELFSDGVKKRSGVLLYGPPGTGKTLLAKAVATTCSLNFFSVKGPELLNMYIGESEANVRRVFQRARDAKPCVIFFDELDSVAPKRGNQGDSGGVMDRIVSQLLAELDGMASGSAASDVFVIGATNRPDLLDPALLRPGRFDRMLYLSVAETHDAQRNILQALTRKFTLDDDVGDMTVIAEQCPFNLTGADFYAFCSDAMLKAMTEKAADIDAKVAACDQLPRTDERVHWPVPLTPQFYLSELAAPDEVQVRVHRRHFEQALAELSPSVSEQEMEHYRQVQQQFSQPAPAPTADAAPAPSEPLEAVRGPIEAAVPPPEPVASTPPDESEAAPSESSQKDKGKGKGKSRA